MGSEQIAVVEGGQVPEIPKGKAVYVRECVRRFFEWKGAGMVPGGMDDLDQFIHWDETENGRGLIDHDQDRANRYYARAQAMLYLKSYTRVTLSVGGKSISFPTVITGENGYTQLTDASPSDHRAFLELLKRHVYQQSLRLRLMGAKWSEIRSALNEAVSGAQRASRKGKGRKNRIQ